MSFEELELALKDVSSIRSAIEIIKEAGYRYVSNNDVGEFRRISAFKMRFMELKGAKFQTFMFEEVKVLTWDTDALDGYCYSDLWYQESKAPGRKPFRSRKKFKERQNPKNRPIIKIM